MLEIVDLAMWFHVEKYPDVLNEPTPIYATVLFPSQTTTLSFTESTVTVKINFLVLLDET